PEGEKFLPNLIHHGEIGLEPRNVENDSTYGGVLGRGVEALEQGPEGDRAAIPVAGRLVDDLALQVHRDVPTARVGACVDVDAARGGIDPRDVARRSEIAVPVVARGGPEAGALKRDSERDLEVIVLPPARGRVETGNRADRDAARERALIELVPSADSVIRKE